MDAYKHYIKLKEVVRNHPGVMEDVEAYSLNPLYPGGYSDTREIVSMNLNSLIRSHTLKTIQSCDSKIAASEDYLRKIDDLTHKEHSLFEFFNPITMTQYTCLRKKCSTSKYRYGRVSQMAIDSNSLDQIEKEFSKAYSKITELYASHNRLF